MDLLVMLLAGTAALYEYAIAHTLFCLIPAFFIAGAMSAYIPKTLLLPYLGPKSPKHIAYPIAVVSGLLLAVCSCTVLPLFAGIKKNGAGIGPAIAFLYTAPATNIVAVLYTASLIGADVAFARIAFSVLFAILIGITISRFFGEPDSPSSKENFVKKESHNLRRLLYLFVALIAILLIGTRISEEILKYALSLLMVGVIALILKRYFSKSEFFAWMTETWGFTKTIFPLLLIGIFFSGIISVLIPADFVSAYLGNNSLMAVILPVLFGIFVYFPTLVEVPMAKTFLLLGMAKGPLLAYLLADPVISLPSILVVRKIMGNARTLAYASLILVLCVGAGLLFGSITSGTGTLVPSANASSFQNLTGAANSTTLTLIKFHGYQQCSSCINLGKFANSTLNEVYSAELASSQIRYFDINAEAEADNWLVLKVKPTYASLYLIVNESGSESVKELPQAWYYTGDETAYKEYLTGVIESYLK
jgi:hypothetical protein